MGLVREIIAPKLLKESCTCSSSFRRITVLNYGLQKRCIFCYGRRGRMRVYWSNQFSCWNVLKHVSLSLSLSLTHTHTHTLTFSEDRPHFSNHVRCTWVSQNDPSALDRINGCPDVRNPTQGIPDFANDVPRSGAMQSVMFGQYLSVSATVAQIISVCN
jgi:hypothetical protein